MNHTLSPKLRVCNRINQNDAVRLTYKVSVLNQRQTGYGKALVSRLRSRC